LINLQLNYMICQLDSVKPEALMLLEEYLSHF